MRQRYLNGRGEATFGFVARTALVFLSRRLKNLVTPFMIACGIVRNETGRESSTWRDFVWNGSDSMVQFKLDGEQGQSSIDGGDRVPGGRVD